MSIHNTVRLQKTLTVLAIGLTSLIQTLAASPADISLMHSSTDQDIQASPVHSEQSSIASSLGPGDIIRIKVSPQKELSSEVVVDEDGNIEFPYIGKMQASGFSSVELGNRLKETLEAKYLKNPTVFVRRLKSGRHTNALDAIKLTLAPIKVFGQVSKVGNLYYPKRKDTTLTEVLGAAGSFNEEADSKRIRVIRSNGDLVQIEEYNMVEILGGAIPDPITLPGDLVFVPSENHDDDGTSQNYLSRLEDDANLLRAAILPVKIFGQITRPGVHYPLRENVSLTELISIHGGLTQSANAQNIRIVRIEIERNAEGRPVQKDGSFEFFNVNLVDVVKGKAPDFMLMQGDLVTVPRFDMSIELLGEVQKVGSIPVDPFVDEEITLVKLVSSVGGFKKTAALKRIKIIRTVNGKEESLKVNAKKVLQGKAKDVKLEPGDIVVVPESFW